MIVLGVDPGTLCTGYGVIQIYNGKVQYLDYGAVKNSAQTPMPARLMTIHKCLCDVIETYHPTEFAIESAFYGKNVQSALKIGHARGVSMLAAVQYDLPTTEYSPREIKKAIVGNGAASKQQVEYMVRQILHINKTKLLHDTSDALAVAICHLHRILSPKIKSKSWKTFIHQHPEFLVR